MCWICYPMDCSPPGSSLHGILQARTLEWGAISFSRGSSRPRDWTQVSCIPDRPFNIWATREAHKNAQIQSNQSRYFHSLHKIFNWAPFSISRNLHCPILSLGLWICVSVFLSVNFLGNLRADRITIHSRRKTILIWKPLKS